MVVMFTQPNSKNKIQLGVPNGAYKNYEEWKYERLLMRLIWLI